MYIGIRQGIVRGRVGGDFVPTPKLPVSSSILLEDSGSFILVQHQLSAESFLDFSDSSSAEEAPMPANAIQLRDGTYLVDRAGNYVVTRS